jgi:hypothetical protein
VSLVDRAVSTALRRGFRRGLLDGNRAWIAIGAAAAGVRVLQWMARPGDPIVVTEELAPGQALVIRHLGPAD